MELWAPKFVPTAQGIDFTLEVFLVCETEIILVFSKTQTRQQDIWVQDRNQKQYIIFYILTLHLRLIGLLEAIIIKFIILINFKLYELPSIK